MLATSLLIALQSNDPAQGLPIADSTLVRWLEIVHGDDKEKAKQGRAVFEKTGAIGVGWLAERAVEPGAWGSLSSHARRFLAWFEPKGEHIGADLLPLLRHRDERVRAWCALAMANVVPPVVDVLLEEIASPDRARRLDAVRAARGFVEHHERVAPALAPFVDGTDPEIAYWATFALAGLAPSSLPALFHALESADGDVRAAAAEGIEKAIYPWFMEKTAMDWGGYSTWHGLPPEMQLREQSNEIVRETGVAPLAKALGDEHPDVRLFAAMALWKLGSGASAARAALEAARDDPSAAVRFWVAPALERTDPDPWRALHALATRLRGGDAPAVPLEDVEIERLARALDEAPAWEVDTAERAAWPEAGDARFEAVRSLAQRALDVLLARAASSDAGIATKARGTLAAMQRELDVHVGKLVHVLDDELGTGGKSAQALVELGPVAMPALEFELLRFPRFPMGSPTYFELAWVLERIGEPALPALVAGLEHWRDVGRWTSAETLFHMGAKRPPVARAIASVWRSSGDDVRVPGSQATWETGADPRDSYIQGPLGLEGVSNLGPDAIPELVRALDDRHAIVRSRAALSLGGFEHGGEAALDALAKRLEDEQRFVALAACTAIERIAKDGSAVLRRARDVRSKLETR